MNVWSIRQLDRTLGEYAKAWDTLHARLFRANPMLDSRFIDAALRYFGDGSERLCIFHRGGMPLAMCILRPAGIGRWASFLPAQMQIGPALLDKTELVPQLIQTLSNMAIRVDFLCNDPDFGDLSRQETPLRESLDHALTMNISTAGGFEDYWAIRPKKLVQNINRYGRRLVESGITCNMVRVDEAHAMPAAVARYARLESSGWKGTHETALDMGQTQGKFYGDVMGRFTETAGAAVYELWFGEHLAASRLVIASESCVTMLKTAYDESQARYAPGRILLHRVIDDLFARYPNGVIEFYTDANADMLAWATDSRPIRHVSFGRNTSTNRLFELMRSSRNALLRQVPANLVKQKKRSVYRVEMYRHPGEFPASLRQLFIKAEATSVEFGLSWYVNLIDTVYPHDPSVYFYVLWLDDKPMAALPALIAKNWWGHDARSLSNFYSALYAPALAPTVKSALLAELLRAICAAHAPLASFRFAPMDAGSVAYRHLHAALRSAGMVPFQFFCFGNWFMKVSGTWADYLATREGQLRSTIKRMGKKFANAGGSLEIIQVAADLERGLKAYESVYAKSWKNPEPFGNFMPGLVRACAEHGWLRMGVAWLGGQPLAAQVWIVANGKASIYKLAYDDAFKAMAPGTLLTALLMQHVFEQGNVEEVDYLIGDDAYKKAWVNQRRERWGVVAYNPRTMAGIILLGRELIGRLVRRLKS